MADLCWGSGFSFGCHFNHYGALGWSYDQNNNYHDVRVQENDGVERMTTDMTASMPSREAVLCRVTVVTQPHTTFLPVPGRVNTLV